jgi:hypothetical protein
MGRPNPEVDGGPSSTMPTAAVTCGFHSRYDVRSVRTSQTAAGGASIARSV